MDKMQILEFLFHMTAKFFSKNYLIKSSNGELIHHNPFFYLKETLHLFCFAGILFSNNSIKYLQFKISFKDWKKLL